MQADFLTILFFCPHHLGRGSIDVASIADFTGLPYVSGYLSGLKFHGLISHDYISQSI